MHSVMEKSIERQTVSIRKHYKGDKTFIPGDPFDPKIYECIDLCNNIFIFSIFRK